MTTEEKKQKGREACRRYRERHREETRERARRYYHESVEARQAQKIRAQKHNKELRDISNIYKFLSGCSRCGVRLPACCLEFHHRDASTKHDDVSKRSAFRLPALFREIRKCDVLCKHCHALLHHPS